ncbi:maleylacetoacetate isomerase [Roseomonas sp. AR75]|uniref:maleylacetoacetate isomerase n=1 Tax=Roseomonas sp. AR75 TaxID=2562311 RepID=UPI001F0FF667|nr:maleylacetoacetate isomerase [Roseomonas sp. AR75]
MAVALPALPHHSSMPSMDIALHDHPTSSAAWRVRIALALKGVAYRRMAVDLRQRMQHAAAYRAVNPQGRVPTLEVDGMALMQSLVIIDWLDRRFPQPRLIPEADLPRARALAMANIVACDMHPLCKQTVVAELTDRFGAEPAGHAAWQHHWLGEGLAALEALADPRGPFLVGDDPGIAEICLVPQLFNARLWGAPLDPYPRLLRAEAACAALPAFRAAHPDAVRGA